MYKQKYDTLKVSTYSQGQLQSYPWYGIGIAELDKSLSKVIPQHFISWKFETKHSTDFLTTSLLSV